MLVRFMFAISFMLQTYHSMGTDTLCNIYQISLSLTPVMIFRYLSSAGMEAILSSDDIQLRSEDVVYNLVLKWAEVHYPQMEEKGQY